MSAITFQYVLIYFLFFAICMFGENIIMKRKKKIKLLLYFYYFIMWPFLLLAIIIRIRYVNSDKLYLYKNELAKGVKEKRLSYIKYRKNCISTYVYFIPSLGLYFIRNSFTHISDEEELIKYVNPKEQIKSMVTVNKFNL